MKSSMRPNLPLTCRLFDLSKHPRAGRRFLRGLAILNIVLILICEVLGCSSAQPRQVHPTYDESSSPEKIDIRNNAASLLYDLLGAEKNVSKILIIKHHSDELGQLIKAISEAAANDKNQLERLATNNPGVNLHAIQLPRGEKAARDAVAKTEEHELLFTSGKEFEFNLLLTQAQAMGYGWHLAKIAAENSSSTEERQTFTTISRGMEALHRRVIAQMQQNNSTRAGLNP